MSKCPYEKEYNYPYKWLKFFDELNALLMITNSSLNFFVCCYARYVALSATLGKNNKLDMFKLISNIQVKSLVADILFTCINEYTITNIV